MPRSISSLVTMRGGAMTKWETQAWMVTPSAEHFGGDLIDDECFAGDFVGVGVEGFFGGAVFDQVDGPEEAFAADVADAAVSWL